MTIVTKKTAVIALAAAPVLALTILARYFMLPFESGDYSLKISQWLGFIYQNDGFAALKFDFYDYNVPYLYLLVIVSYIDAAPDIVKVKSISVVFDYVMAFFVYRIVRLKYREEGRIIPILAGLVTVCAPTVILNSSAWGQCDSVYTAFMLMSLYCLLVRREKMACTALGLAFSFKPMAIFFAPLFLGLLARRQIRLRSLFLIPTVYLVLLLPAWLIGRPFDELLLIYPPQVTGELSPNAPNLYRWTRKTGLSWFLMPAGVIAAMIFTVAAAALLCMSRTKPTKGAMVLLAALSVFVLPYILPFMHNRYFFPADVISIILAFWFPRLWYIPVLIGIISLLGYRSYLLGGIGLGLGPVLPFFLLFPIGVLGQEVVRTFAGKTSSPVSGPNHRNGPAEPG